MLFSNHASRHWAAGLPVIPIAPGQKRPLLPGWQRFADRMPTEAEQEAWLYAYGDHNMGLPLGPQSGLVAVDIDSDDEAVKGAIMSVLPKSPWQRVGKKGMVLIYKWLDNPTCRIRDENEKSLVEILSRGTQIVIPPSIHPDTKKPYWANAELVDVIAQAPILPRDADVMIRGSLNDVGVRVSKRAKAGVTTFVPAGFRDNALVSMAGLFAMGIAKGELTLVEALGRIKAWVENMTEKVVGDSMSIEKAQQKIVEFLIQDVAGEKRKVLPVGWDEGLTEEDKKAMGVDFTEEQVEWSFDKVSAYLAEVIIEATDLKGSAFLNSIDFVLNRIAYASKMTAIEQQMLLRTICDLSGKQFTMQTLRKRIKELRDNEVLGNDQTEIAQAVIRDLEKQGEIRCEAGRLWCFNGAYWGELTDQKVREHIAVNYGKLPAARKDSDHTGILKLMRTLRSKTLKQSTIIGVNFANGYLTTELELKPHAPEYGCTYALPFRYVPAASDRCSMWNNFLYELWGEDEDYAEKTMALQEAMALTMFGLAPEYQRAICLIGPPETGKSRVLSLMQGLMPPDTVSAINPTDWKDKFLPAEMYGKLINVAGELSENKQIESARFKEITEGAIITAQRKNGQPFQFQPRCAHWFSSNHMPKSTDSDTGFTRRWLFLGLERKVTERQKVVNFEKELLAEEGEEIASWAVAGIRRVLEQKGFTLPNSHRERETQLKWSTNYVRWFLEQGTRVIRARGASVDLSALHEAYYKFSNQRNIGQVVRGPKFREMLGMLASEFGFSIHQDGEKVICRGLGLKPGL